MLTTAFQATAKLAITLMFFGSAFDVAVSVVVVVVGGGGGGGSVVVVGVVVVVSVVVPFDVDVDHYDAEKSRTS